jgi:hypothetical protein
MPTILASGTGYPAQNLDDDVFQNVFDELQAVKLPLVEGSLEKLVNLLQPVHQRSLEQQVRFSKSYFWERIRYSFITS